MHYSWICLSLLTLQWMHHAVVVVHGLREFQSPHHTIPVRFEWRELSSKEIDQWYRPIDKCMMQANDTSMDTQSYYMSHCGGKNRLLARFCGPGMGNKGACPMPLSTRSYFVRGLRGYTDAQRQPARALFTALADQRRELIIVGDSLMRQTMESLICELNRENVTSIETLTDRCSGFSIGLGSEKYVNMSFFTVGKLSTGSKCTPGWTWKAEVEKIVNSTQNKGALIAINAGVWYSSAEDGFDVDITSVLSWLQHLMNSHNIDPIGNKRLSSIFFESYPQHWNTSTGHYVDYALQNFSDRSMMHLLPPPPDPGHCCHPLLMRHDWRNIRLHQLVRELRASHISVLPVAEAMEDTYMMHSCHAGKTHKNDCTHYCFWPLLMQYQWEALAVVAASGCVGSKCKTLY